MDAHQFDALVSRLSTNLTRRHSLGVLGVVGASAAGLVSEADAKKKKKKKNKGKKKPTTTQAPTTQPPTTAPPFCASQPDGAPCGYCRKCQSGVCQADATLNETSCGSAGGLCWNGTCNPVPSCAPRYGACQTVADCCSNGSTAATTTCPASGSFLHQCLGRSDAGQPCHVGGDCVGSSGTTCRSYVCRP